MDTKSVLRIDAGNTRVTFDVRWFGVIHVRGSFTVISGSVTVPGEGTEDANVTIEVDPTSVRTGISSATTTCAACASWIRDNIRPSALSATTPAGTTERGT